MAIIISYSMVIAAAVAAMVVGFVWYSDRFWGREWRALMGYTAESEPLMGRSWATMFKFYLSAFILELLMAYVLAHLMVLFEAGTLGLAAQLAFWVWLGFVFPVLVGQMFTEGKSWRLTAINLGHRLAALLAMATALFFLA